MSLKPYYSEAGIEIFCGDCREVLPQLNARIIDLVLTDPPYGVDWNTDYRRFTTGFSVERKAHAPVRNDQNTFDPTPWLTFPNVIIWGANCFSNRLPLGSWLVWDKRFANGSAFLADGEAAWMNRGHGLYIYSRTQQGCIRDEEIDHPTQKPVALMEWCLQRVPKARTVLDPYCGSGTTLIAAKDLGLRATGIEIEERYCEISANRLRQSVMNFGANP